MRHWLSTLLVMTSLCATGAAASATTAPRPVPTPAGPSQHEVCVATMRVVAAVDAEAQDRYRTYNNAASDTDNAGQGAQTATRYTFPLAYAGAELKMIEDLVHADPDLWNPALERVDSAGVPQIVRPVHALANDVQRRDKDAAAWSNNRYEFFRYLSYGYTNPPLDVTPRTALLNDVNAVNIDHAAVYNRLLCGPAPTVSPAAPH